MNTHQQTLEFPHPIQKAYLQEIFHDCSDLIVREVYIGEHPAFSVWVCWMDGLTSGTDLSDNVLRPLTDPMRFQHCRSYRSVYDEIFKGAVYNYSVKNRDAMDDVVSDILSGSCALIFDSLKSAITFEVRSTFMRSVDQSTLEKTVKGSKEAFIENIRVNTCLVRRKLRTHKLKTITSTVGRKSDTNVSILYIEGIAKDKTISMLQERIGQLDVEGLLTAGYLEQCIVDAPRSPFPQLLHTERPDTFGAMLLSGRVGLLIDGLPVGFLVPVQLSRFLQVTEDSAHHFSVATMLVLLRYTALVFGLLLPGLYVAVAMYHQEMIPTELLTSVIEAKQKVPFSSAMEVLGMLVAFELLQEAGLRLPSPIGDTVSIIGALIVGQAAVEARIVSPIAVIIVAFSGISSYTLPSQDLASAIRVLRIGFVLAAIGTGLFGIVLGFALLVWHLCTIESYGVSYLAPFVDDGWHGWLRSLTRRPMWDDTLRNRFTVGWDRRKAK